MFKLSEQTLAYVYVITGCTIAIIFHHFAIATDMGFAVAGAGLQAYTTSTKQNVNVDHATTINQTSVDTEKKT